MTMQYLLAHLRRDVGRQPSMMSPIRKIGICVVMPQEFQQQFRLSSLVCSRCRSKRNNAATRLGRVGPAPAGVSCGGGRPAHTSFVRAGARCPTEAFRHKVLVSETPLGWQLPSVQTGQHDIQL